MEPPKVANIAMLILILAISAHCQAFQWWSVGQAVDTTSGIWIGHAASQDPTVSEYLGIRFGQSTAPPNRFLKPLAAQRSNAFFQASQFGRGCIPEGNASADLVALLGEAPPSSEDCLFLNVWTKPQSGCPEKKAVMVWIAGGGFIIGESNHPLYMGAHLAANQDVVVVTLNYRTNIFGFPGAPFLPDLNLGLLDQRLAIEWVKKNIARFGGDPERITIVGESAGGSSVDYYSYAWVSNPIVKGLIAQSGTAMAVGIFSMPPAASRASGYYNVSEALGCGGASVGAATLECMNTKTATDITNILNSANAKGLGAFSFGPTIDEKLVFSDYFALAKAGKYIKKPFLGGSNHNESLTYTLYNPGGKVGDAFDLAVQKNFRCSDRDAAKARVIQNVPVWRYHLALTRTGNNTGAIHTSDIHYLFNTPRQPIEERIDIPNAPGLNVVIQDAWGAFARDPVNGLKEYGWPRYDDMTNTLVRLGFDLRSQPEYISAGMYDDSCDPSPL